MAKTLLSAVALLLLCVTVGCSDSRSSVGGRGDSQRACDEFSDEQLCDIWRAIEAGEALTRPEAERAAQAVSADGLTPLLWAVIVGNAQAVSTLMAAGADATVTSTTAYDTDDCTVQQGMTALHVAVTREDIACFLALLEGGADPNVVSGTMMQETPVFAAVRYRNDPRKAISLLKEYGADLDYRSGHGTPAIYAAVWLAKYQSAIALLEAGADPKAIAINGKTRLAHLLLRDPVRSRVQSSGKKNEYDRLLKWLGDNGEDMESVRREVASGDY